MNEKLVLVMTGTGSLYHLQDQGYPSHTLCGRHAYMLDEIPRPETQEQGWENVMRLTYWRNGYNLCIWCENLAVRLGYLDEGSVEEMFTKVGVDE